MLNFLKDRTNEYRQKCEAWDRKNEQELNKLENDIKALKGDREIVQAKFEEIKNQLKKEQEGEKVRLEKDEQQRKVVSERDEKEKAKDAAIKWIQAKLVALHPFKPAKGKGRKGMGKKGKKGKK